MKHLTLFVVTLLLLFVSSQTADARYITEHQQLHEIIGTHSLTDFNTNWWGFAADLPPVVFDDPLELGDVDRLTITVTGTLGPVTVCGDGITRPDECYTLNAGIDHNWNPGYLIRLGGIYDPDGTFSDDDPAFERKWVYDDPGQWPIWWYADQLQANNILCDGEGNCLLDMPNPNPDPGIIVLPPFEPDPLSSLQFYVGPLYNELREIPFIGEPQPCLPPDLCPVPLSENLPICIGPDCLAPSVIFPGPATGLHIVGSVELTITDAYVTREWDIPEPASLTLLAAAGLLFSRRR